MSFIKFLSVIALFIVIACKQQVKSPETLVQKPAQDTMIYPDEKHFKNIRQLTFGGNNAEAYWSFDNAKLVFQSDYKNWNVSCDQIFFLQVNDLHKAGETVPMLSTGKGRTTCSYFMPGDTTILYASTHAKMDTCPAAPERMKGKYLWAIYPEFDIYVADLKGNITSQLTNEPGYDAEATVSPKGDKIVFTSTRSGDLELYTMDMNGKNVKQITKDLGYDGGAFFSPDGNSIVFRASRPKTDSAILEYKTLLKKHLVAPTEMEIFVCNVDGSNLKQITNLGKANWAPYFHPSGQKIIFSSNHAGSRGFNFNLFMIGLDGQGLEKISHDKTFDAFPMFSPDGKRIAFSSNRFNGGTHDTNVFVADWVD